MILEKTADGTYTIYNEAIGDYYHSFFGARQEAGHVFIRNGLKTVMQPSLNILEVGMGTGLNAMLTAVAACSWDIRVDYTGLDTSFPGWEITGKLAYARNAYEQKVLEALANAPAGESRSIMHCMQLMKIQADFLQWQPAKTFDLVYFDAFGPDKQPEMWTEDRFAMLFSHLNAGGVLVTYSAKGSIRRMLMRVGFRVYRLPGPPGKRHMLKAQKF